MSRYEHLKIFQDVYSFNLRIYHLVGNLDREHKFSIGQKIKELTFILLDDIVLANSTQSKTEILEKMQFDLERLRLHIRLIHDLKIINSKRFESLSREIEEISKQLNGWNRWSKNKYVKI